MEYCEELWEIFSKRIRIDQGKKVFRNLIFIQILHPEYAYPLL